MESCKTCKYWKLTDEKDPYGIDLKMGDCSNKKWGGSKNAPMDGVAIWDQIGEWGFVVGPDFGCIHHEPKI